jgi:VanZ family protein
LEAAKPSRAKQFAVLAIVAGLYWLVIFAATHFPVRVVPKDDPYSLDKLAHFSVFAVLAILLCGLGLFLRFKPWQISTGVLLAAGLYALVDEASQTLVANRRADIYDWLADMAGAALGVTLFWAARSIYRRVGNAAA